MPILKRKPFVPRKRHTPYYIDTLKSAIMMFILSLREGSEVDVFYPKHNCFYEATVVSAGNGGGFCYAFKNRQEEQGFVYFNHCLHTWRPPMSKRHLTPKTMLLVYDALNK